jgi:hypothetical protein
MVLNDDFRVHKMQPKQVRIVFLNSLMPARTLMLRNGQVLQLAIKQISLTYI